MMVSFLNVSLPVLLQVNRSEGGTLLPWPNGSLLSGKLMQPTEGAGAMLMLGNYRVRVEVPPNTPMGHVWMQLMQREMPGQFRLLTRKQAELMVTEMLQKKHGKQEHVEAKSFETKALPKQLQKQTHEQQEWLKMPLEATPFAAESYGNRLMLFDDKNGETKGMLQKEERVNSFRLSGRLDLEHLGGLVFSIEEKKDEVWDVQVHFAEQSSKFAVEIGFGAWLSKQAQKCEPRLVGSLFHSIPSSFEGEPFRNG